MLARSPTTGILLALLLTASLGAQEKKLPSTYPALLDEAASNRRKPFVVDALVDQAARLRVEATGIDAFRARLIVHQDLAEVLAQRGEWVEAIVHVEAAILSAESLGDAVLLRDLCLQLAAYAEKADARDRWRSALDKADTILAALPDRAASLRSARSRAALLSHLGKDQKEMEAIYTRLLQDPGADRLSLETARARHTASGRRPLFPERWTQVLDLARVAGDRAIQAEAHDQLGNIAAERSANFSLAAQHFTAAEELGVPLQRNAKLWISIVQAYVATSRHAQARQAMAKAAALVDAEAEPGRAAELSEAESELLAQEGDMTGAYRKLRRASELHRRARERPSSFPMTRMLIPARETDVKQAKELAAIRHALRDAELERTRLRARNTAGLAALAVLTAALLGLAYAYKRRTAAALAAARDNAELRADRTQWQMLRYQLNPHFLFNALSSLGGLVATEPAAAGRVIDRLSEFCQLALKGSNEELRPLERELHTIRAYLDIEQAGAGDSLVVRIDVEAATLPCLLPPLLLQPLVENALKYGGQTSEENLEINLAARLDPGSRELLVEVANTGRWIEPDTAPRTRDAVGLANVRERLARFGGPAADLTFVHDGQWVRARLRLPARPAP
jgi:hypothetical protein